MARPRTPTNVLDARGAFNNHPERKRKGEPKAKGNIGKAPDSFNDYQKKCFDEIVKKCCDGVLSKSDYALVEMAALLIAKMRLDPDKFSAASAKALESLLGKMAMTPADRSRVIVEPETKADPWESL